VLLDPLGDLHRPRQRLLVPGHRRVHLGRGPDVELVALEPHPVRVVDRPPRVDAEQQVVRRRVVLLR
jgi:hypothetical protein